MLSERLVLRPEEVATALGISRSQAYALITRRDIPSLRVGRRLRVTRKALDRWIEQQATKTKQD